MPLHLDYRPREFSELFGARNQLVAQSISSVLQRPDRPQSFLLHGPSGCGKTTLARLIATAVGCASGDLYEIDGAADRGIQTGRELKRQATFSPMFGSVMVFILDEVHRTTGDMQSALLKLLEDTPAHCVFVLCTTEPDKLLPALRNRCTQYNVALLDDRDVEQLLDWVLKQEQREIPTSLKKRIITAAEGCPRQALVCLDQVIDLSIVEQENFCFSVSSEVKLKDLLDLVFSVGAKYNQAAPVLVALEDDPESIRRTIIGYAAKMVLGSKTSAVQRARCQLVYEVFKTPFYNNGKKDLIFKVLELLEG